jgi:hypothetical protein
MVAGNGAVEPQRRAPFRRQQKRAATKPPRIDYSRFSHVTHVTTQKLACDSCHKFPTKNWKEVRKGDAAFPDVAEFPEHSSCLNCHRQQFFAHERPAPAICSNCHVKVTPRYTARFLFPSLGDIADSSKVTRDIGQEFTVNFPHDKHLDVVGWNGPRNKASFVSVSWRQTAATSEPQSQSNSCPVCHQTLQPQGKSDDEYVTPPPKTLGDNYWLKKGTFKTIPNSHTVCFTCHNADLGIPPAQSECDDCHKLTVDQKLLRSDFDQNLAKTFGVTDKTILTTWVRRGSSGAFRHEGGEHPNVSCMNCHSVATMNTVDKRTLTVPIRSCGGAEGCHVTATSDDGGILNYEIDQRKTNSAFVCTKCHISFGKDALPDGHLKAILALKK